MNSPIGMNEHFILDIILTYPYNRKTLRRQFELGQDTFQALQQLPRDREIPLNFEAQRIARDQIKDRRDRLQWLAEIIQSELEAMVNSQDTVNGYEPEEWKKMNQPPASQL